MKFLISRTSMLCKENKKPCEEAVKEKYKAIVPFTNNEIRELEGWFIEINSLEELLEFQKKYDEELVISRDNLNKNLIEIEIYDSYREV